MAIATSGSVVVRFFSDHSFCSMPHAFFLRSAPASIFHMRLAPCQWVSPLICWAPFMTDDRWRLMMSVCEFRKWERAVCKPIDVCDDDVLLFCGISVCARMHIAKVYFQTTHMQCMSLACMFDLGNGFEFTEQKFSCCILETLMSITCSFGRPSRKST